MHFFEEIVHFFEKMCILFVRIGEGVGLVVRIGENCLNRGLRGIKRYLVTMAHFVEMN